MWQTGLSPVDRACRSLLAKQIVAPVLPSGVRNPQVLSCTLSRVGMITKMEAQREEGRLDYKSELRVELSYFDENTWLVLL